MKLVLLAVFPFPSRLRASFATLLPNADASVLSVQALLGHRYVDTTVRYARVYDGTVAADYMRVVGKTERRFNPLEVAAPRSESDASFIQKYSKRLLCTAVRALESKP